MMLAVSLTIVFSTSFTTSVDIQTSKLEEESQKALAAAEAGIEAAAKSGSISDLSSLSSLTGSGITGNAQVSTTATSTSFASPVIKKDEQYTYYLANYDQTTNVFTSPYTGNLTFYYGSQSTACSDVTIELSFIYVSSFSYRVKRFIADSGQSLVSGVDEISNNVGFEGKTVDGVFFRCRTSPISITTTSYPNIKVLLVRSFSNGTKVGIEGSQILRPQGKIITSEAQTASGVKKKIELFQSYPQLPAEFYVAGVAASACYTPFIPTPIPTNTPTPTP